MVPAGNSHYLPWSGESLQEIQHVHNLLEMKVIKPSETCWLAHEQCIKSLKASYTALVVNSSRAIGIGIPLQLSWLAIIPVYSVNGWCSRRA